MNILNKSRKERGVGLIEILIVLVVLVIGWAAIAALQGKLLSGSSATKARNIALELAREKTEELRGAIEKGQYDDDLITGTILGEDIINAKFVRSWALGNVTLETGTEVGHLKQLVMTVTWKNNEDIDEKVVLNSMIAFSDPMKSVSLVTGGADPTGRLAPLNSETAREGPGTLGVEGSVLDEEGDPDIDTDNIYTSVDEAGNLVVYQGAAVADGGRFDEGLTVFGGKLLKMTGTIYYESADRPMAQATAPAFCATFDIDCGLPGLPDTKCVRYVCYAGGDCSEGGSECSDLTSEEIADLPDLNGGWYGKIGDFFPTLGNVTKFPTICMGDPLNLTTDESGKLNESFISIGLPARLYVTKRLLQADPPVFSREGINTSFDGHDTLIASVNDSKGTLCGGKESPPEGAVEGLLDKLIVAGAEVNPYPDPGGVDSRQLADYKIIRCLGKEDTNYVVVSSGSFDPVSVADLEVCQPPLSP